MKDVLEKIKSGFVKVKNILVENKKTSLISLGVAVVIVTAAVLCLNGIAFSEKVGERQQLLTQYLEDLGKEFYENFYYDAVAKTDEERVEFVKKYGSIGIKVNLDNLSRYSAEGVSERIEKFVNDKTNEDCDKENTKVTIYPKEPYGKSDYSIETSLVCGFDN